MDNKELLGFDPEFIGDKSDNADLNNLEDQVHVAEVIEALSDVLIQFANTYNSHMEESSEDSELLRENLSESDKVKQQIHRAEQRQAKDELELEKDKLKQERIKGLKDDRFARLDQESRGELTEAVTENNSILAKLHGGVTALPEGIISLGMYLSETNKSIGANTLAFGALSKSFDGARGLLGGAIEKAAGVLSAKFIMQSVTENTLTYGDLEDRFGVGGINNEGNDGMWTKMFRSFSDDGWFGSLQTIDGNLADTARFLGKDVDEIRALSSDLARQVYSTEDNFVKTVDEAAIVSDALAGVDTDQVKEMLVKAQRGYGKTLDSVTKDLWEMNAVWEQLNDQSLAQLDLEDRKRITQEEYNKGLMEAKDLLSDQKISLSQLSGTYSNVVKTMQKMGVAGADAARRAKELTAALYSTDNNSEIVKTLAGEQILRDLRSSLGDVSRQGSASDILKQMNTNDLNDEDKGVAAEVAQLLAASQNGSDALAFKRLTELLGSNADVQKAIMGEENTDGRYYNVEAGLKVAGYTGGSLNLEQMAMLRSELGFNDEQVSSFRALLEDNNGDIRAAMQSMEAKEVQDDPTKVEESKDAAKDKLEQRGNWAAMNDWSMALGNIGAKIGAQTPILAAILAAVIAIKWQSLKFQAKMVGKGIGKIFGGAKNAKGALDVLRGGAGSGASSTVFSRAKDSIMGSKAGQFVSSQAAKVSDSAVGKVAKDAATKTAGTIGDVVKATGADKIAATVSSKAGSQASNAANAVKSTSLFQKAKAGAGNFVNDYFRGGTAEGTIVRNKVVGDVGEKLASAGKIGGAAGDALGAANTGLNVFNKFSLMTKTLTKAVPLIGAGVTAFTEYAEAQDKPELSAAETATQVGLGVAGNLAGGAAGAALGATIGSVVPVIGTAIGGLVGGVAGTFMGDSMAEYAADFLTDDEEDGSSLVDKFMNWWDSEEDESKKAPEAAMTQYANDMEQYHGNIEDMLEHTRLQGDYQATEEAKKTRIANQTAIAQSTGKATDSSGNMTGKGRGTAEINETTGKLTLQVEVPEFGKTVNEAQNAASQYGKTSLYGSW